MAAEGLKDHQGPLEVGAAEALARADLAKLERGEPFAVTRAVEVELAGEEEEENEEEHLDLAEAQGLAGVEDSQVAN